MTKETNANLDAFFEKWAHVDPEQILTPGQPWGALEEMLLGGARLAPGIKFTLPTDKSSLAYKEAQPWVELLTHGKFSDETLSKIPLSYQTTDRWLRVIEQSVQNQGMTWLHALFLGIAATERGSIEESTKYFQQSIQLRANPVAFRCLAVLQTTVEAAWPYYQQAWGLLHTSYTNDADAYQRLTYNFITEISYFLQQNLWYPEMGAFINDVRSHNYLSAYEIDAFLTMEIKYNINNKSYDAAKQSLGSHCFPTYAKARDDLMNMWNTVTIGQAELVKGASLTTVEKHQARIQNKIPENIGCQYASEYCQNYW